MSEIGLFEAVSTSRAVRRFRRDPIPDSVLLKILQAATQAPNGSNRQRWRFLVIRDPGVRRQVGDVYRRAVEALMPPERVAAGMAPAERRLLEASWYLAKHMGTEPPVLLLVCQEASSPAAGSTAALLATRSRGASIYPAAENVLLAARACGLGGCLTTAHLIHEDEIKVILGIPEQASTFALIPLGYPQTGFGRVRRNPVGDVSYGDRWGVSLHLNPT